MLVKTGGKKGSLIIMGKKCVPTMIKTGGKRGKDIIIIGDNSNCGHKQQQTPHYTPQYIPIPVYHQQQHYYPKVEHHYSYHDATAATYGHGGHGGGGDAYHGGDHMSYDQGYGHLLGGGSDDYGGY
ncbi:hypothetical protein TYRP_020959 [Tyrophagus putrescentiae]|nr:hypothetical protein TYRP_020959 [Tyrophagus putrescentiae]